MHSVRSSGEGDSGKNLLHNHHQLKLNTVLFRQDYDSWSSKFFLLVKILGAAYVLASPELHRVYPMATQLEVRGVLLRSSQSHYLLGVDELARSHYGTKYIPVLQGGPNQIQNHEEGPHDRPPGLASCAPFGRCDF